MTIRELQDEIIQIKQEKGISILAHSYQSQDILEIADYVGDSFGLSLEASRLDSSEIIMCGVRFMAETVKLLSAEKHVILANAEATCPMAEQIDVELLKQLKNELPDYTLVSYINTTADVKAICDVCVTSSSAVKIIKNIPNDKIIFIPDCNLGDWVARQVPQKQIKLVRGGCPTHLRIITRDVERARALHPNAELLVHPECHPSVVEKADFVGSTTEIMLYAGNGKNSEYIIGTENSITEHLQFKYPQKHFYSLSKDCICHNMKATSLMDVYRCLTENGGEEIILSAYALEHSRKCIDEMLRLGNE